MKKSDERQQPLIADAPRPPKEPEVEEEEAEPDEPQPSMDDWQALYGAALELRKLGPWEWIKESDIFAVQDPERGEIGYCLIIGSLGETFGLNLFLGTEGLHGMHKLLSGELPGEGLGPLFHLRCLSAIYYDMKDIEKPDREIIGKLGLKPEGPKAYPEFRSFRPGYLHWFYTRDEARFMTAALRQSCDVVLRAKQDAALLRPPRDNLYLTRVPVRDEGGAERWEDRWIEPAPQTGPMPDTACRLWVDEARLHAHSSRAARTAGVIEVDVFPSLMPIQERKDQRPYFPRAYLAVDHASRLVLCFNTEKLVHAANLFQNEFFFFLEDNKIIPSEILVENDETERLLQPLTSRLGITLTRAASLPAVKEARAAMHDFLRRKGKGR